MTAAGQFTGPKYPDAPGRETFAGEQVHTGVWHDPELEGKRVAVVGVGAAGVQVIGALAPEVEHLTVFQRQPHWIMPNFLPDEGNVGESELWLRLNLPYYLHWARFVNSYYSNVLSWEFVAVDAEWVKTHPLSISASNDQMMQLCLNYVNETFGEGSELARKLTPDFPFFGKRPVRDPGDVKPGGYYWALLQPHVELVTDWITEVVPEGIVTADGTLHELDVIVWASGMVTEFLATTEAIGRDGAVLSELWGAYDARTYLGGTVPGFPNLFVNDGPNTGIGAGGGGHNFATETISHYIFECLQLMFERGAGAIEVTQDAHDCYNARIDEEMPKLVWAYDKKAHGYYRNDAGRVIFQNPFPANETWNMYQAPDESAFILHERLSVLEGSVG
jgi:4-hydroxyacetophenone monooxygenase